MIKLNKYLMIVFRAAVKVHTGQVRDWSKNTPKKVMKACFMKF